MTTVGVFQIGASIIYRRKEARKLQKIRAFNRIFYVLAYNYTSYLHFLAQCQILKVVPHD